MAMEITTLENDERFDPTLMEEIVLSLADMFEVRIPWNFTISALRGGGALVGGLVGGFAGRRFGAAVGAGLGVIIGATEMVNLRKVWTFVKELLKELFGMVFNFIRRLDPNDYCRGLEIFMNGRNEQRELCNVIVQFIAIQLGRVVLSIA